jgi:rare lipoprotein A
MSVQPAPPMPPGVSWGVPEARNAGVPSVVTETELTAEFGRQLRPGMVWQVGFASFYGYEEQGQSTANGERFNYHELTAAHRVLPFGTRVRVTDLVTHRSVIVRINDRGPFFPNRILDLSVRAAREIGVYSAGVQRVRMEIVSLPDPMTPGRYTVQAGWFHDDDRVALCLRMMERDLPYRAISYTSRTGQWVRYEHGVSLDHEAAVTVVRHLWQRDFPAYIVRLD